MLEFRPCGSPAEQPASWFSGSGRIFAASTAGTAEPKRISIDPQTCNNRSVATTHHSPVGLTGEPVAEGCVTASPAAVPGSVGCESGQLNETTSLGPILVELTAAPVPSTTEAIPPEPLRNTVSRSFI